MESACDDIFPEVGMRQYLARQEPFSKSAHSGAGFSATVVANPACPGLVGGTAVIFTVVCPQEQTRTGSARALAGAPVEKRHTKLVTSGGEEWRPSLPLEVANTQLPTSGGDAWRPGPSLH